MQIVIVGAGKVGYELAAELVREGHDITVIDRNEDALAHCSNTLDVIACHGNGGAYATLKNADAADADLLIAATANDEVNMLCCLAAHKLRIRHTIARVRDPEYYEQLYTFKEDLGLSMAINPELAAAQEIARILRFPSATKVELFAKGRAELASCRVRKGSLLDGMRLMDLPQKSIHMLVCAVERDGQVFIPFGSTVVESDDILYFTGAPEEMERAFKKMQIASPRARSVMIAGGSRIAYYLAEQLGREKVAVKIIEHDRARCEMLTDSLPLATILYGDAADHELLLEEGLNRTDAFVSLTGLDEGNILSAVYAAHQQVRKVVAKVNNDNLVSLIPEISFESIISPKRITVNRILSFVRAKAAGDHATGSVESVYRLVGGRVEISEFRAGDGPYLDVPLKDLPLRRGTLIACLVRGVHAVTPNGDCCIHKGDGVLIATADRKLQSLEDILE